MTNLSWQRWTGSWFLLGGDYFVQDVAQSVQAGFPTPASVGDPLFGGGHRRTFDPARARPPDLLGLHEPALLEHLDVLEDSGKGHGQGFCQFTDRSGPQGEAFHHAAPALVGQRLEGPIQVDGLVKHVLEYRPLRVPHSSSSLGRKSTRLNS